MPFWKTHTAEPLPAIELQKRYLSAVLNYVAARIGGGTEAEDITANVFAAVFAARNRCPLPATDGNDDPIRAWLFGIARRKVADSYRRRSRRPEVSLENAHLAPTQQEPESRLLADEAARTLQTILEGLPEMQREVLRLKYLEDLSLKEIGWVLHRSPNAIGQLLHRARETVRTRGNDYFGPDASSEEASR